MRKIPLSTFEIGTIQGREMPPLVVADTIRGVIETKQGGMTITEMRQCIRIQAAVDTGSNAGCVYLEDADHAYLKERIEANQWAFACPAIIEFVDAVNNAAVFDPNKSE